MEDMQEDSEENYNKHFSAYIDAEVEGGDLEELLAKVSAADLQVSKLCMLGTTLPVKAC